MQLIDGPLALSAITEIIAKAGKSNDIGAHSLFIGQVRRDEVDGKHVRAIEYSAYEEMVVSEANKITKTILSEFSDITSLDILHSRGIVNAGEISLLVIVSGGHRDHAIRACSRAVELVKEKLPVWKKEIFEDDSSQWKDQ